MIHSYLSLALDSLLVITNDFATLFAIIHSNNIQSGDIVNERIDK